MYVFGVDVGGTTVKLGLFFGDELLEKWEIVTRTENGGENILPDIAGSIAGKMSEKGISASDVKGIGVGVPGPVDAEGVVHKAVNLNWGVFNIEETLSKLTGIRVKGSNDANVAALGEMWKGAGEGAGDMLMVTLGTGIGGGVISNGEIVSGYLGAGGEIGHICVNPSETGKCGCGKSGCMEYYASATGITRLAKRFLLEDKRESRLREGEVSAKTVFDGVKEKDALCLDIAEEFGRYLGFGLANVGSVTNPEVIVIGGGVSKAGDVILGFVDKNYKKHVFHASEGTKFVLAKLGNDAGIYGCAKLVL